MHLIPTVIEKSQMGERAYDIYSRLLKERIVFLGGPITDDLSNTIIAQLLFLDSQDKKTDINIYKTFEYKIFGLPLILFVSASMSFFLFPKNHPILIEIYKLQKIPD